MLEEYERAVHMNTSILLSLLPVGGGAGGGSEGGGGVYRMRETLLREMSNVVIGDDAEEDDDEGAYSDIVGVNMSTSLGVLILNPAEWFVYPRPKTSNHPQRSQRHRPSVWAL